MVLHKGAIHCVARDVDHGRVRVFAFDRMSETVASDSERFDLPYARPEDNGRCRRRALERDSAAQLSFLDRYG